VDPVERARRLAIFGDNARACRLCHENGLIYVDADAGPARPILAKNPTAALGLLVVGEAPNHADTYEPSKGHLTYDDDTDPTGRFMRQLLIEEAGLLPEEIADVLFTNAALCLPARRNERHEPYAKQLDSCKVWLDRLIQDADITTVVTMGAKALDALNRIERHGLSLQAAAGTLHQWRGVTLLPLFHSGLLGRMNRNEAEQRSDMRALRRHLRR
jgi:uracil-DNA glycosylase